MSQSLRQSNLFAAEDWRNIYRAFTQVNFNAYDFNTIKSALVDYLRQNYPEDFNDYINSSEFVAIIDMLAYLGQSLAFRMDLNSQENFVDTAERRESILRLARMLSYKPKRNIASRGLVKITAITCNDDIFDSNANNLNGTTILWNDPNNPDWFEQFILVMNSIFVQSNPFGQPVEKAQLSGVRAQVYRLNNDGSTAGQYKFDASVNSSPMPFELANIRIEDSMFYEEREPNKNTAFHIIFQNDGNGNQSANTGFFFYFKQGVSAYEDNYIQNAKENRVIEITPSNINENDVWVQTIDEEGNTLIEWRKVPSVEGSNIIYNDIPKTSRNIFAVNTLPDNRISIRFGDGRFGNVPTGIVRTWFRISVNESTVIRPQDVSGLSIPMTFVNKRGLDRRVVFTINLQETITNGKPSETEEEIRRRAPQIYYTQNRMVSGEDYNVFPLDDSSIAKVKSVNRIYSGHSRFIDINDPTGKHQNTNVFADDGMIYKEYANKYSEVELNDLLTPDEIISTVIQPYLQDETFRNFVYENMRTSINTKYQSSIDITQDLFWKPTSSSTTSSTGVFINTNGSNEPIGPTTSGFKRYITTGAMIKLENAGWVSIYSVAGAGDYIGATGTGSVILSSPVEYGDKIIAIMPLVRTTLTVGETAIIREAIVNEATFAILYDFTKDAWYVKNTNNGNYRHDDRDYEIGVESDPNQSKGWLQLLEFKGGSDTPYWSITSRGLRLVFESYEDIRFYFVANGGVVDQQTGLISRDHVRIFKTNGRPERQLAVQNARLWPVGVHLTSTYFAKGSFVQYKKNYFICTTSHISPTGAQNEDEAWARDFSNWSLVEGDISDDIVFNLSETYTYDDGYVEPRRVILSFTDIDNDGAVDNPEAFDEIIYGDMEVDDTNPAFFVHFERYTSYDGYDYYRPIQSIRTFENVSAANIAFSNNPTSFTNGDIVYISGNGTYLRFDYTLYAQTDTAFTAVDDQKKYRHYIGRDRLNFQWKHYASSTDRIDPAITNVIDTYVLTSEYDYLMRQWVYNDETIDALPTPPSIENLRITYSGFNDYKMVSDQLIWHPVKYKLLFGSRSADEYRATIKVTKLPTATLSDGEIKASVISNVNKYFEVENWNFGDKFYFSELGAYIHQQLSTQVAGVVLVPLNQDARFGNLYEIKSEPDEIFISCATVDNVEVVQTFTEENLRVNR